MDRIDRIASVLSGLLLIGFFGWFIVWGLTHGQVDLWRWISVWPIWLPIVVGVCMIFYGFRKNRPVA